MEARNTKRSISTILLISTAKQSLFIREQGLTQSVIARPSLREALSSIHRCDLSSLRFRLLSFPCTTQPFLSRHATLIPLGEGWEIQTPMTPKTRIDKWYPSSSWIWGKGDGCLQLNFIVSKIVAQTHLKHRGILCIICRLGITISVLHNSGLTGFLKLSYRETPSMDLSQVQTVPWNLNPGLQGIAVTLKKYLFFNVEKISST